MISVERFDGSSDYMEVGGGGGGVSWYIYL